MKKIVTLVSFLFFFTAAICQQKMVFSYTFKAIPAAETTQYKKQHSGPVIIHGKIIDSDTGEPIPETKVFYEKKTVTGVTTDPEGNFMLEIPGAIFRKKIKLYIWSFSYAVQLITVKRKHYTDSAIIINLNRGNSDSYPSKNIMSLPATGYKSGVIQFHNNKVFKDSLQPVSGTMKFTNTGTKPLIIESVHSASSDCIPYFDKEPVLPGKEGSIRFRLLTDHLSENFIRIVSFKTNASAKRITLQVSGQIKRYE